MKISLTLIAFFGLLLSSCKKEKDSIIPPSNEVVKQKQVEYQISTDRDYSATWMKDVNVTVMLSIAKTSLNGGETILWDSTFNNYTMGQLSQLPNQISIKKSLPVLEEQEKLTAKYSFILAEPLRAGSGSLQEIEKGATSVIVPVKL